MDPLLALVGEDVPSNACQQCERTTRHGN
jgi:hypothetical protein